MTLLITGGSGYLGRHLSARAKGRFPVLTTYRNNPDQLVLAEALPLDLTDRETAWKLVHRLKPKAIIHTAAINPGQGGAAVMMRVNRDGSANIAAAAAAIGARLIHLSTDTIHSGHDAPYVDNAPPTPINDYGRSKAAAEAAVQAAHPEATLVRTSLIYGLREIDRGTASFRQRLAQGEMLTLFNDVIRQPVWVETLAEALLRLVDVPCAGPLNVAGGQALSRETFGRRMLAFWQVESAPDQIQACPAAAISATIPLDLRMTIARGEKLLDMPFPGVDEVVAAAS